MTAMSIKMPTKPWYKEPWPWVLIAIPFSAVIMGVVLITLALESEDGLVVDDYYWKGKQINQVLEIIESGKLNRDHYATGIAYLLLYLVYKLDYLVKPEGYMMETLERINRLYSTKEENKSMAALNQEICKEFRQLIKRSKEEFFKEMYQVPATFGITIPVGHDRIVDMIDANLHQMDWYLDNGHAEIAMAVPGFIVSYSLFLYAPPKPDRDLLELFFRFTEPAYFDSLGIPSPYHDPETGGFNKRNIKKAVTRVIDRHKPVYSRLNFPFNSLFRAAAIGQNLPAGDPVARSYQKGLTLVRTCACAENTSPARRSGEWTTAQCPPGRKGCS